MVSKFRRSIVAAVVAASAAVVVTGPTPASAAAPCQVRDVIKVMEYSHTVAVVGTYTSAGAIDVQLTCGIVRNGVTVSRYPETAPGPIAVVASTGTVSGQVYSVCYDLFVTYVDRSTFTRTCP